MKWLFCIVTFICFSKAVYAQQVSGKWVGKIYQDKGEFCQECNIELDINRTTEIFGMSHHYQKDSTDIRMSFSGYFVSKDSINLQEKPSNQQSVWIVTDTMDACFKNYYLKYRVINNKEFLLGRMDGRGMKSDNVCIPATVIFSRELAAIYDLASIAVDSLKYISEPYLPLANFTSEFNATKINKTFEVTVNHPDLQIRMSDYLKVDNDTVSIYLNRQLLTSNVWISKKPVKVNFKLDPRTNLNELLLYAENLGKVPPNTSLLEIIDHDKTYRIKIESDKQKTAAIYLRYKPDPK